LVTRPAGFDFDYSVRDGVRVSGSRGGKDGPRPARILELRFDPEPETERRILAAVARLLDGRRADDPLPAEASHGA